MEVIERQTGRRVVGFTSSSQQEPDLLSCVFVLDGSSLLGPDSGDGVDLLDADG